MNRNRTARLTLTGAFVVAVAGIAGFAVPAQAHPSQLRAGQQVQPAPSIRSTAGDSHRLYSQDSDDAEAGIPSQRFDHTRAIYDSRGADDFIVPSGSWTITQVHVTGHIGSSQSESQNVAFYVDAGGLPGRSIVRFRNLHGTVLGDGSFDISLGDGVTLPAGTYWLSVQVQDRHGDWTWDTTRALHGNSAAWKNPGDGFGSGCDTFSALNECWGDTGHGPDFMFILRGTSTG